MRAIILAAGRGERMRPLTDSVPKPLLKAGGRALIEYHIDALVRVGIREIVINHAHLGSLIEKTLGDGRRYGAEIVYSPEQVGLETGGGIFNALPLLGNGPFMVVNGDIWTDFPLHTLPKEPDSLVHLVFVDNPLHHPEGDFVLKENFVQLEGGARVTYSGIGVYRPELFDECQSGVFPLAPVLRRAIINHEATGVHYRGSWMDIGTPQRLRDLDAVLSGQVRAHS